MNRASKTVFGFSWMASLRILIRLLGILKIAVLARILTPSQFGNFGISLLVLGFLEIITETGINVFLIQEKDKFKSYLDSSWIVSIGRGLIIALLIIISSFFIPAFFNSPSSQPLFYVTALIAFVRGFVNPVVVKFQMNLEFNKEFMFKSSLFFVDTAFAILIAYITRSEIALVLGMLASAFFEVLISLALFSPKPKLRFEKEKLIEVTQKGKWVTLAGIFNYSFQHLDDIVVGKLLGPASLGLYQQAYKISTLPISEAGEVFNKVNFPTFVDIREDKEKLFSIFKKTTLGISAVVIVFGSLIFIFSQEIVRIVLGEGWLTAVGAVKILAVFGIIKAILNSSYALFLSIRKQHYITVIEGFGLVVLGLIIVPLTTKSGIEGAAFATIISVIVTTFPTLYYLAKVYRGD